MVKAALWPSALLRIDETKAIERISSYLRKKLDENNQESVLLGFSGGLDSSVLLTIAVHALGSSSVRPVYLYDHQSVFEFRENVRSLSRWLGVRLEEVSIEQPMRQAGVYSSYSIRISSISGVLNKLLHKGCQMVFRENPFITSLRIGKVGASGEDLGTIRGYRKIIRHFEEFFNSRHVYRRQVLETEADAANCLLLGATNKTEWLTGWFVKGGIDDMPNQPLAGLYKTQVRQLGAFLSIPERVLSAAPSPDMMKGITDEFALGIKYIHIDLALDFLEGGLTREDTVKAGVKKSEIDLVREMKALSSWKRCGGKQLPPVQGGIGGEVRLRD